MNPLFHLDNMLSEFEPLFKYNNFNNFRTYVGFENDPALWHHDTDIVDFTINWTF